MLQNKCYKRIHYSEFIAAWDKLNESRFHQYPDYLFEVWLLHLKVGGKHIPKGIIWEIMEFKKKTRDSLYQDAVSFSNNYCLKDFESLLRIIELERENEELKELKELNKE